MLLLHQDKLSQRLANRVLLLDTSTIIKASHNKKFLTFLTSLSRKGAVLLIVPAVYAEFTEPAKTDPEYDKLESFIFGLGVRVFAVAENAVKHDKKFNVRLRNACPGASYIDALLCKLVFALKEQRMILVTSDHAAIPHFFTRKYVLSVDGKIEPPNKHPSLHNIGFYIFSPTKYKRLYSD